MNYISTANNEMKHKKNLINSEKKNQISIEISFSRQNVL